MKSLKLITAALAAITAASMASAQATVVNVSGSTAFRTAAVTSEISQLSHVGANLPGGIAQGACKGGGPVNSASVSIVYGYDAAGTEIMYRNHWTGSAAGVYDLAHGTILSQLPTSTPLTNLAPDGSSGGTVNQTDSDSAVSDAAFTDVQAADASASVATAVGGSTFAGEINGAGLLDCGTGTNASKGVYTVLFRWVAGLSSTAFPGNNMTQQAAASLVSNGSVSLANITGNSSDASTYLLFIGRNEDSGTRVDYEAESLGGGTQNNAKAFGAVIKQFMVQTSTTPYSTGPYTGTGSDTNVYNAPVAGGNITSFKIWPQKQAFPASTGWQMSTNLNFTWNAIGHSGYNGGGDVANILKNTNPVAIGSFTTPANVPAGASNVYFVSMLGAKDAAGVITAGGVGLNYNGVAFSQAAVEEGAYTPWTFEHFYRKPASTGTLVQSAVDSLADLVAATPTATLFPAGINIGDLLNGLGRGAQAGARIP